MFSSAKLRFAEENAPAGDESTGFIGREAAFFHKNERNLSPAKPADTISFLRTAFVRGMTVDSVLRTALFRSMAVDIPLVVAGRCW